MCETCKKLMNKNKKQIFIFSTIEFILLLVQEGFFVLSKAESFFVRLIYALLLFILSIAISLSSSIIFTEEEKPENNKSLWELREDWYKKN